LKEDAVVSSEGEKERHTAVPTATTSTLSVSTSPTTKQGNYTLTVAGSGLTHSKSLTLQVKRR